MKLLIGIFSLISAKSFAQADIVINHDTTINNTWTISPKTTVLRITNGAKISGTGTIVNGIIDANPYAYTFDTSLTVSPWGIYNGDFSANWYGVNESNQDNTRFLQRAIDVCAANNIHALKIQRGTYKISSSILIARYSGGWQQVTLRLYGETSFWDSDPHTTLVYSGVRGYALGTFRNKGSEIDHIKILGKWQAPATSDTAYFNTSYANFHDAQGIYSDTLTGLAIDVIANSGGSTGCYIHDMIISNFSTLISVSENYGYNADILYFDRIQLGDGRVGFQSSQPQEKGNRITGINCWGSLHTLFQNSTNGAGSYNIDGANVAGHVIRLFNISQSGWFSSNISHVYAENIATIGILNTGGTPLYITGCTFDFIYPTTVGVQTLLTSNNPNVKFQSCAFRYYGLTNSMLFSGIATYENCLFSGVVTGNPGSVFVNYSPVPPNKLSIYKN